jgi:NAD(P)-dependent dehydrogenase (short-subunit alcohol dehydrogenase family)
MKTIKDTIALVTGANRGIGKAIVDELLARGASRVYAGVRNPASAQPLVDRYGDRVAPLKLDVTDAADIAAAAPAAPDVQLLVNNAGFASGMGCSVTGNEAGFRDEMEINVFGPLALAGAFRQSIESARGTIVNLNSVASLVNFPFAATYSASKAAAHSITQALRAELGAKDVQVIGVYPGPVDTDMAAEVDMPKATPAQVAAAILDGIESGAEDVFPDDMARDIARQWGSQPKELEHQVAAMAAEA